MLDNINKAYEFLQKKFPADAKLAIVLGSGLGPFVNEIQSPQELSFDQIPGFATPSVEGHEGKLIYGKIKGVPIIALQGRLHAYEGYSLDEVTLSIRVLAKLGIKKIIITNASGGINFNFQPGDIVTINDHINLSGRNPLIGKNLDEFGPRFPDMSEVYSGDLALLIRRVAQQQKIELKSGVYAWMLGPTYETPAEVRMLRTLGADLVGMSTVPEVIVAHHSGMEILGVSCVTNHAAGIKPEKLNHDDVKDVAEKTMSRFCTVLTETIALMGGGRS